jgi:hypothetical protein
MNTQYYVSDFGIVDTSSHGKASGNFACFDNRDDAEKVAAMLPKGAGRGFSSNAAIREWGRIVREMYAEARAETRKLGGKLLEAKQ